MFARLEHGRGRSKSTQTQKNGVSRERGAAHRAGKPHDKQDPENCRCLHDVARCEEAAVTRANAMSNTESHSPFFLAWHLMGKRQLQGPVPTKSAICNITHLTGDVRVAHGRGIQKTEVVKPAHLTAHAYCLLCGTYGRQHANGRGNPRPRNLCARGRVPGSVHL